MVRIQNNLVEMITEWPSIKITKQIWYVQKHGHQGGVANFPYVPISCEWLRVILTLLFNQVFVSLYACQNNR